MSNQPNDTISDPLQAQAAVAPPPPNSTIALPFIIINASKETSIDCQISSDKRDYLFNFNNSFEIHDDIEVLKRMGLAMDIEKGEATPDKVQQAKLMLPKALQPFVEREYIGHNQTLSVAKSSFLYLRSYLTWYAKITLPCCSHRNGSKPRSAASRHDETDEGIIEPQ